MATTTENIVFDTTINLGNSGNSIKSVKAELRQLNNELATLEPGSARFVEAAKRAGELKDTIGDVRNAVDAFNPEGKFKAFAGAVGIAANGFSALQGAMSIFGADSENLNKVIAQTQGAIALATGLNGLLGMGDAFLLLRTQIVSQVIPSLLTLRGALIATGIGALAVAVGVLYANWDKFVNLIAKYIPSLSVLNDKTAENTKLLEANTKANEDASKGFKKQIDLQIAGIEDVRKREIATLEEKQRRDKQALEKEYINASNFKQLMKSLEVAQKKELKDLQDKFDKEDDEKKKAIDDKNIAKAEKLKKQKDYELNYAKEINDLKLKVEEGNLEAQKSIDEIAEFNKEEDRKQQEIEDEKEKQRGAQKVLVKQEQYASELEDLKGIAKDETLVAEERYLALDALNQKGILSDQQTADAKIAIAQKEKDLKLQLLDSYAGSLSQISALVGKDTVEGKVLAIAAATISTYTAIAKTLAANAANTPLAIASSIGIGLSGFAAVKGIIDTPVPGQGGGGGTVPNFTAPSIPQIPQSVSGTRLNQTDPLRTINEGRDSKVFVTETDITKTQNKVKNIIKKATIK
jgi:hypothetical protein